MKLKRPSVVYLGFNGGPGDRVRVHPQFPLVPVRQLAQFQEVWHVWQANGLEEGGLRAGREVVVKHLIHKPVRTDVVKRFLKHKETMTIWNTFVHILPLLSVSN